MNELFHSLTTEALEKFERTFEQFICEKYPNHGIEADDFDTWIQNAIDLYSEDYDEQFQNYFQHLK